MKKEYCKLHNGFVYYIKDDGSIVYTCPCSEEYQKSMKKPPCRKTVDGDLCCDDTVLWLAEHGALYASVPEWAELKFSENYLN
jgi:hypothetical protein